MPFPFTLPTTSSISLADFFTSSTHPSLLLTATTHRSVLRDTLKKHKRLAPSSQSSHLSTIQDAINTYLPFLFVLNAGLQNRPIAGQPILVSPTKELEVEWRTTISSSIPGREPARIKLKGLHNELAFVLQTLAYVQTHLARVQLALLHKADQDHRAAAISTAMKYLLEANSIHSYILSVPNRGSGNPMPVDTAPSTQAALASLALAEATLIVVLKDDPYAAAVAEDRNKENKDWMFRAPSIPKVRAHLFARLCLAAADHASQAYGSLQRSASTGGRITEDLSRYVDDLQRTARAKACRFLGIDAELSGKIGDGLAWLRGAKKEMGLAVVEEEKGKKGLKGLKQSWVEKREDRRVEKGKEGWGMDAGKFEESRVVEWLEGKWTKENDTVSTHSIARDAMVD